MVDSWWIHAPSRRCLDPTKLPQGEIRRLVILTWRMVDPMFRRKLGICWWDMSGICWWDINGKWWKMWMEIWISNTNPSLFHIKNLPKTMFFSGWWNHFSGFFSWWHFMLGGWDSMTYTAVDWHVEHIFKMGWARVQMGDLQCLQCPFPWGPMKLPLWCFVCSSPSDKQWGKKWYVWPPERNTQHPKLAPENPSANALRQDSKVAPEVTGHSRSLSYRAQKSQWNCLLVKTPLGTWDKRNSELHQALQTWLRATDTSAAKRIMALVVPAKGVLLRVAAGSSAGVVAVLWLLRHLKMVDGCWGCDVFWFRRWWILRKVRWYVLVSLGKKGCRYSMKVRYHPEIPWTIKRNGNDKEKIMDVQCPRLLDIFIIPCWIHLWKQTKHKPQVDVDASKEALHIRPRHEDVMSKENIPKPPVWCSPFP